MKSMPIHASSSEQDNHVEICQQLPTGELRIRVKHTDYSLDSLMGFAARANAKRGFLFLSKVLAKHWPVRPSRMLEIHENLAAQIDSDLPEPIVFIAMAETGVGLGQGVFEAFQRRYPQKACMFMHTTRYHLATFDLIEFEEAHSHAPRQFLHMPHDARLHEQMLQAQSLVMIDDEASTGNTFLNLKDAFLGFNPHLKRVQLATITNFMGEERNARLTERFNLPVSNAAVLVGEYQFTASNFVVPELLAQSFQSSVERGASDQFGRAGIDHALVAPDTLVQELSEQFAPSAKVLVLGTGEFMHPAFVLAKALAVRGVDVRVQSTTRSPILEWGAVASKLSFPDNYGEGISNYVYNLADQHYQHIVICHETPINQALRNLTTLLENLVPAPTVQCLHFKTETVVEKISLR